MMATDEVRAYNEDVSTKQKMAMSAKYHKRGHGGRKYMLNDPNRISKAEWERRNGPVTTYHFGKPMNWDTFKNLPFGVQEAFLESLLKRYSVNVKMLSVMFDRKSATVYQYMIKHHGKIYGKMIKVPTLQQELEFQKFLGLAPETIEELKKDVKAIQYEFLNFTEFKKLPVTTQAAFLKYLYRDFQATTSEIAYSVFDVKYWNLGDHIKNVLSDTLNYKKPKGFRMPKEQKVALKEFMSEGIDIDFIADVFTEDTTNVVETVEEIIYDGPIEKEITNMDVDIEISDSTEIEEIEDHTYVNNEEEMIMSKQNETTNFSFEMGGDIDFNNFGKIIEMMIAGREVVKIRVECSVNK